ncbi:MAG: ABC transporter ATP-binding protein [Hyphomicrobiales bacterium]|nr:MAG: ABC transporter ATP-binding protein [Hyphomicrobiales bacterium]
MTDAPILIVENLSKSFGALKAVDGLNLTVQTGELHAIIGPNGAGKTTLVHQLSGQISPDSGSIRFQGLDITKMQEAKRPHLGLVRSFQITSIFPQSTVLENVAIAVQMQSGHSFRFIKNARADKSLSDPALSYLQQIGLESLANEPAHTLAHGQQRQLELAMALALKPKLLILDEPMAGMGADESAQMVSFLKSLKGTLSIVLIEHDMDVVFALSDQISVLVYGQVIATGIPDEIRNNPKVRTAYLGEEE